jgi:hypothetical protein
LDILYVLQRYSSVFHMFLQVFQMHDSYVLSGLRHILQVLHLNVSKVDWVLHLLSCFLLLHLGISSSWSRLSIRRRPLLDASGVGVARACIGTRNSMGNEYRRRCSDIWALASLLIFSNLQE